MKRVGAVASFYLVASMSINSMEMLQFDTETINFLKRNSDSETVLQSKNMNADSFKEAQLASGYYYGYSKSGPTYYKTQ